MAKKLIAADYAVFNYFSIRLVNEGLNYIENISRIHILNVGIFCAERELSSF